MPAEETQEKRIRRVLVHWWLEIRDYDGLSWHTTYDGPSKTTCVDLTDTETDAFLEGNEYMAKTHDKLKVSDERT